MGFASLASQIISTVLPPRSSVQDCTELNEKKRGPRASTASVVEDLLEAKACNRLCFPCFGGEVTQSAHAEENHGQSLVLTALASVPHWIMRKRKLPLRDQAETVQCC